MIIMISGIFSQPQDYFSVLFCCLFLTMAFHMYQEIEFLFSDKLFQFSIKVNRFRAGKVVLLGAK